MINFLQKVSKKGPSPQPTCYSHAHAHAYVRAHLDWTRWWVVHICECDGQPLPPIPYKTKPITIQEVENKANPT